MNERIKELLEEATEVYDYWHQGKSVTMVDHKMFAELIIQECVNIVQTLPAGYEVYRSQIEDGFRRDCIAKIQEKFGVTS